MAEAAARGEAVTGKRGQRRWGILVEERIRENHEKCAELQKRTEKLEVQSADHEGRIAALEQSS